MRTILDKLNESYAKYYSPTEDLAVHEITVLYKCSIIFKQYIPKKHKWFGIKSTSFVILRDMTSEYIWAKT
jgi:hypothetical protein